jgi:hypothetical protein
MPFTSETATGRPKGAEGKDTKRLREAIAAITNGSVEDLQSCFAEIREENPVKFIEMYLRLLEYTMPKLRSIDTNIELGDNTIQKVTINVNAQRINNTSNNSISEELGQ